MGPVNLDQKLRSARQEERRAKSIEDMCFDHLEKLALNYGHREPGKYAEAYKRLRGAAEEFGSAFRYRKQCEEKVAIIEAKIEGSK